jgi:2-isopropylmalate synthase
VEQQITEIPDMWKLVSYEVSAASRQPPTVRVTLGRGSETRTEQVSEGDGPMDALFRAIEKITGVSVVVRDFRIHSVSRGQDAQAESTIEVEHQRQVHRGRGISTDSVEAAALAFLNVVNRVSVAGGRQESESIGAV